tara:strand:+ start:640 stop:1584 length:945 start_codon:yes stop_codon:yes gene_type:complete
MNVFNSIFIKPVKIIIYFFLIIIITFKVVDLSMYHFYGIGDPIYYQYSKILGYELKPNQEVTRRGKIVKINNLGMRSSYDWASNNNQLKILFLGDSITYGGSAVNNNELFSEKTCYNLSIDKYICGNYAVNGYGIESIIKKIKYRDIKDEDILIVVLTEGSVSRGINHLTAQPFWSKNINKIFPAITEASIYIIDIFKNKIKFDFTDKHSGETNSQYSLDLLFELKVAIKENNKRAIVIYSPEKSELNLENSETLIFLKKNFTNFIDMSKFIFEFKEKVYADHVHLNSYGHSIYAEVISDFIFKNNSISKKNID